MYYDYFGLKQPPFKITPDTRLFYPGGNRGEILDALVYAITSGEGIVKVVGEVGSGKTMLCRMLQEELPATVEIVYLANPSLTPDDILHAVAFELKLPIQTNSSRLQVMNELQEYLIRKHAAGQQVVVFVEEAQSMPVGTLEEIRFLSNLETQQYKLLQIVLFGQPELDEKIARREIRQLKERITYSFQLNPFQIQDVRDYLNTRLRNCGCRTAEIFSPAAIKAIGRYSRGLVRRINILADKSMLAAYAGNDNSISARHVRQAARDSEFIRRRWPRWGFGLGLSVVMLAGSLWWFLPRMQREADQAGSATLTLPRTTVALAQESVKPDADDAGVRSTQTLDPRPRTAGESPQSSRDQQLTYSDTTRYDQEQAVVPGPQGIPSPPMHAVTQMDSPVPEQPAAEAAATVTSAADSLAGSDRGDGEQARILGLNEFYKLQDSGDTRLTEQELLLLKRWVENLPPEVAAQYGPIPEGETCSLCWTIIYRPLISTENL